MEDIVFHKEGELQPIGHAPKSVANAFKDSFGTTLWTCGSRLRYKSSFWLIDYILAPCF